MVFERNFRADMPVTLRQSWIRSTPLALFVVVVLAACGGGGTGDGGDAQAVLTSMTVSPSELTLDALDATERLEATARDPNGNTLLTQFSWSSSDTAVVTVNADGQVTASGNGTATVTVRSGSVSAAAPETVEQARASVKLSQDELLLTALGAETQLEASVLDANDDAMSSELTWASSDPAVVSVYENGNVTAQANGTATVMASIGTISAYVTVIVEQAVSGVQLEPETVILTASGQRAQLAATALDANGHPVAADIRFTSSDSMVADIDGQGLVSALRNGMTTVTATAGSVSGTPTVTVMQVLARITLAPNEVELTAIGQTAQLQVRAVDANGMPMAVDAILSSSDPGIASVNAAGLVTARTSGAVTVTATTGTVFGSATVRV